MNSMITMAWKCTPPNTIDSRIQKVFQPKLFQTSQMFHLIISRNWLMEDIKLRNSLWRFWFWFFFSARSLSFSLYLCVLLCGIPLTVWTRNVYGNISEIRNSFACHMHKMVNLLRQIEIEIEKESERARAKNEPESSLYSNNKSICVQKANGFS